MLAPSISLQHIQLDYAGTPLFQDLNLTLPAAKCSCLLGQSGVGKSSLLKVIAGLLPTDGNITCSNEQPLTQQISYMPQDDLLLPWLSVLENVLIGPRLRTTLTNSLVQEAKELLATVGLSNVEKKFPHQLSGGMRQRVALARTLLENKPIVLMDEPFARLDAITRYQLQTLAATLLKNRTTLLVTHDPLEALRLGERIYILAGMPAKLHLALELDSATPRDCSAQDLLQHQATLFQALLETSI